MQPYKFHPVDESEVIADTVIAHHSFTDLPDVWQQTRFVRHWSQAIYNVLLIWQSR